MIILYIIVSILVISQVATIIYLKKELKTQKSLNATLFKNQKNHYTTLINLSSLISKQQQNIDKQHDILKGIEIIINNKLNPLFEKNEIVNSLRNKLHNSEATIEQLRSTILRMSSTIKHMQKKEKIMNDNS